MARKMLIDASHAEELRVVVCNNGKIEEFDYQNNTKTSQKGDIFLAKITRVEAALQAAFVEFGGNKHGFLPFSEIHPTYYQIPVADKEKLIEEMQKYNKSEEDVGGSKEDDASGDGIEKQRTEAEGDYEVADKPQFYRRYRIQEVIKKDQVILVQIDKEERGSKGASFTTYISLAGRYCVLMPNATKGGGVSRKITDENDRKRLKKIASELTNDNEEQGAIIIRTAGAYKTKLEIKRDHQYLIRLWNNIREYTLKANAPAFIHEEGDVIKRAIRDLYNNEIEEILVEGNSAFENARDFMKLVLPRHMNKIKHYNDKIPLYSRYGVEEQIAELYSSHVKLKSGGYLVINQTEALVAIDVNSGRATRERNIEKTAVTTNIEAAHKIAEQLHLRDLSGLIVIDFIDMEDVGNRKEVERELKYALSKDKAKIQIGRISNFGLLEMSRQRLNKSLLESNTEVCLHCDGRGRVRHLSATAIAVLRAVEREVANLASGEILVSGALSLILNLLNNKRDQISKIEQQFGGKVSFYVDETAGGDSFFIEKKFVSYKKNTEKAPSGIDQALYVEENDDAVEEEEEIIIPEKRKPLQNRKDRKKIRHKFRHDKENNISSDTQESKKPNDDSVADNEVRGYDSQPDFDNNTSNASDRLPFKKNRPRRKNNFKKHNGINANVVSNDVVRNSKVHHDDVVEDHNPAEMAEIRKKNQSLLKEIWKKIID